MTRFEAFLDDLDQRWTTKLPDRLTFRVIGSAALFLQTAYERGTKDGDVLRSRSDGFDDDVCEELSRPAGKSSPRFDRNRIYLDLVNPSLPFLPSEPTWHRYPGDWSHFGVVALDVADVCVSKLKRWMGSDRQDVGEMVHKDALDHTRFIERFRSMVTHHAFDARAEHLLPIMVERLHEVERDLFAQAHVTPIELPEWISR